MDIFFFPQHHQQVISTYCHKMKINMDFLSLTSFTMISRPFRSIGCKLMLLLSESNWLIRLILLEYKILIKCWVQKAPIKFYLGWFINNDAFYVGLINLANLISLVPLNLQFSDIYSIWFGSLVGRGWCPSHPPPRVSFICF